MQEEARLEGLDKIFECQKATVGLVIVIVDAARWRVGDKNIQNISVVWKMPEQLGDESGHAGIHLGLCVLVGFSRFIANTTAHPCNI